MANNIIKRTWNQNRMVNIEDLSGMAFQSESGGHTFEVSGVDDSGTTVSLSGTVTAVFLRADNAAISMPGTISNGKASVTLSADCYTVPGRFLLTVFVTSSGQKVAVYAATGSVTCTTGTSAGTVPPLVTDSIQTQTIDVSGSATFEGPVDITSRRSAARLSSAGWYRVMKLEGASSVIAEGANGLIVDFKICRNVDTSPNEVHKISLLGAWNAFSFCGESSVSNVLGITKIRVMKSGSNLFVDLYYNLSTGNTVSVFFDAACASVELHGNFTAQDFSAVAVSPSGESLLVEYGFAASASGGIFTNRATGSAGSSSVLLPVPAGKRILGAKSAFYAGAIYFVGNGDTYFGSFTPIGSQDALTVDYYYY